MTPLKQAILITILAGALGACNFYQSVRVGQLTFNSKRKLFSTT